MAVTLAIACQIEPGLGGLPSAHAACRGSCSTRWGWRGVGVCLIDYRFVQRMAWQDPG